VSLPVLSVEGSPLLLAVADVNSQELYVFAMKNKESPSIDIYKKCSYLFAYFPSLESCVAANRLTLPCCRRLRRDCPSCGHELTALTDEVGFRFVGVVQGWGTCGLKATCGLLGP
jgi:hypothetical protein